MKSLRGRRGLPPAQFEPRCREIGQANQPLPVIVSTFCFQSGSDSGADSYRMRRAQNRRSQFPQRYCLIDTNLNNLSSKSRRRERLIRSLLQSGHVITRKRLYSLIGGPNIQSQLTWYHGSTGLSLSRTRKKGACFLVHKQGSLRLFLFGLLSRVHARESSKRLYACGRMRAEPEKSHHQNDDQQQHQRGEFFYAHRSSNEAVLSGVVEP